MRVLVGAVLLLAAGLPASVSAQTGSVAGIVFGADSEPLSHVRLRITGTAVATSASATGDFLLVDVPAGRQMLDVRRIGYAPVQLPIRRSGWRHAAPSSGADVRKIVYPVRIHSGRDFTVSESREARVGTQQTAGGSLHVCSPRRAESDQVGWCWAANGLPGWRRHCLIPFGLSNGSG